MEVVGGFMVMMSIISFFLAVVWLVMPFVVFAIKGKQDRTFEVLEAIERRLAALEARLHTVEPDRHQSGPAESGGASAETSGSLPSENADIPAEASTEKSCQEASPAAQNTGGF